MSRFSDMLIYLRKRKDMSQQELADKLNMTRSAIGMYETGKREPDLETFEIFADFFNVDMNTLTGSAAKTDVPPTSAVIPSDDDIKFALFGTREIDDDVLDRVKQFAKFAQENEKNK